MAIIRHRAIILIAPAVFMIILTMSCRECPTEPDVPALSLTAPYVETSVVWLKISSPDSTSRKSFIVQHDTVVVLESSFNGKDTLISDKTVEPNTSYTYTLNYVYHGEIIDETESTTVTTLDISSRDFQWNVYYFGGCDLSALEGVSIINKDNIWAVGEIAVPDPDSSYNGTGCRLYNAVQWNGEKWDTFEIHPPQEPSVPFFSTKNRIYSFSEDLIWFVSGGLPIIYNGTEYYEFLPEVDGYPKGLGYIYGICGSSPSSMYFIGEEGHIVHYDGSTFETISSGTNIDLREIDGNEDIVFSVGYKTYGDNAEQSVVIEKSTDEWQPRFSSSLVYGDLKRNDYGRLKSVRVLDDVAVFSAAGVAILKYYYSDNLTDYILKTDTPLENSYSIVHLDGYSINDLCLFTVAGEIIHYNGVDFNVVYDFGDSDCMFFQGDFKDDTICLVGEAHGDATIIVGRR